MSAAPNYYDLLGVARDSTVDEIKRAYKKAALLHHPDKGGDPEKFKECNAAVEALTDLSKRSAYDAQLLRARSRDGFRGSYSDRANSTDRPRAPAAPPAPAAAPSQGFSRARPPRPPPTTGAVEIPADPGNLSAKELKELLVALGIDHGGCLEKSELLELLRNRKAHARNGSKDTPRTPRAAETAKPESHPNATPGPASAATNGTASAATNGAAMGSSGRAQRVKLLSLGAAGVGKSCLIKRYCEGRFVQKYITTIGIDYGVKPVKVLGIDVKVNFFDASGGDEFKEIRTEFYDNASGVVLVYDVTDLKTFRELDVWLEEAERLGCPLSKTSSSSQIPFVILCANKVDLSRRVVMKPEGMQFANKHGMYYYETSAASGESVAEALNFLFEKIVNYNLEAQKKLGAL